MVVLLKISAYEEGSNSIQYAETFAIDMDKVNAELAKDRAVGKLNYTHTEMNLLVQAVSQGNKTLKTGPSCFSIVENPREYSVIKYHGNPPVNTRVFERSVYM